MTISPKRILWPTDFSELSLHGARYAQALAGVFDAKLYVVHVIRPMWNPDAGVTVPLDIPTSLSEDELLKTCRNGLERLVREQFREELKVGFEVLVGNPWTGVCEYAEKHQIDLIVVTTHGHTGLKHVLIGGTAERIVQHAPCAVLTVKSDARNFLSDE